MSEYANLTAQQAPSPVTTHNLGEKAMAGSGSEIFEQSVGYLSPEFIEERTQFYVDRNRKVVMVGCGDDREPTDDSAGTLAAEYPEALNISEGYASVYGGSIGIAKNILVAGTVQYGPSFISRIGGLNGAHAEVLSNMQLSGMIPTLHSAAKNEESESAFNPDSSLDIGCAYAAGVGATSGLLTAEGSLIRDVARQDQKAVFGTDNHFEDLVEAHRQILENGTEGSGAEFAMSRESYTESEAPIMILAGKSHASAQKTGLIVNLMPNKIRNTAAANKAGKDFYSIDIAAVAQAITESFRQFDLNPELLMRAFLLDATPVRAVLASHDSDPALEGKLDPRNLAMGIYGSSQEALAALHR